MDSKIDETRNLKVDKVLDAVLEKLEKKYQCMKHLGGGEFSNVYLVRHKDSGEEYALKIMDYHYLLQKLKKEDPAESRRKFDEIKKRFFIEANLYEKIDHPNIVKIIDTGVVLDRSNAIEIPFMLMNYIKGSSLADVIKKEAPFSPERLLKISENVLGVLDVIHQHNIIHRDIKPANIMIEKESGEAIIIDFGIAKDIVGSTKLTITGSFLGSPAYMAPERFDESGIVGPGIDIYSFGVVLFEILTGKIPFPGNNVMVIIRSHRQKSIPNVSEKNTALPPEMDAVLAKAMAKDPEDRFQSAMDFLNALKGGKIEEPKRSPKKFLLLLSICIVLVVVLLLLNPFGGGVKKVQDQPSGGDVIQTKPDTATPKLPPAKSPEELMEEGYKKLETFYNGDAANTDKLERCGAFLKEFQNTPGIEEKKEIVSQWLTLLETEINFRGFIDAVNKYIKDDNFSKAEDALKKAQEINDNEEVNQLFQTLKEKKREYQTTHGEETYNALADFDLKTYLDFKTRYPQSEFLPDLKKRLKEADKHLPPENYWNKPIKKNSRGYYEFTFETKHNNHHMVYIPARKIWMDKYEVSWLQFRRYLTAKNIQLPPGDRGQYIKQGGEFPAVVTHDNAVKYSKYYGLRLPRGHEWELAAGKETAVYPWGNEEPAAGGIWRANIDSMDDNGDEKDGFNGTAPVKSFEPFSSPFGIVNMAGNAWEWAQGKILKGGGFLSGINDLKINESVGGREDDKGGFRCVKDGTDGS